MPQRTVLFNTIFPGHRAKGSIGEFCRTLEGGAFSPSMRGQVGGRSSIARQLGDDCGNGVVVDGVK